MKSYWFVLILVLWVPIGAQSPFPLQQYGYGGAGQGRFVPTFHSGGEFPSIGNANFQLVCRNLRGGASGLIWLSHKQANTPLPPLGIQALVDLTSGCPLPVVAQGASGRVAVGVSITPLPIPNAAVLVGSPLFLQGFFLDTPSPLSVMYSQGLSLDICNPLSSLHVALYDRATYQKQVVAAQLGSVLWNANAVKGFTYVGTNRYSCGGQTHWMVTVKDNRYGIEFMLIPGGSFLMGDLNNTGGSASFIARPIHWVHLEPFLLARTEITQAQWAAVLGGGNRPWQGKHFIGPKPSCAANYISMEDAIQGPNSFCSITGWRLPTESEWEYACRAGTQTAYYNGSNVEKQWSSYAWYGIPFWSSNAHPQQAGKKLPNAFGLHDMAGNVQEWCQDSWHYDYNGAPANGQPWGTGSLTSWDYRATRGGNWQTSAKGCRSSCRGNDYAHNGSFYHGLRPAVSLR